MKEFYLVLSRSHTTVAMLVRTFTGKYYSHASLGFTPELDEFHSFGRKNPKRMLPAGYITEGIDDGYFGMWPNTKILVLKGHLEDEDFELLQERIRGFEIDRKRYRYNIMGLVTSYIGIPWHRAKHYTCSGFVAYLFRDILDFGKDYSLVEPEDFYKFDFEKIYEGTAGEYDYEKLSI